jgi:hypothetical protein
VTTAERRGRKPSPFASVHKHACAGVRKLAQKEREQANIGRGPTLGISEQRSVGALLRALSTTVAAQVQQSTAGLQPVSPTEDRKSPMTDDETESLRRAMLATGQPHRDLAEATERWTTEELKRDFVVHSFHAPFVHVTRKADGAQGSVEFTHYPRFYFSFVPLQRGPDAE